jgi:peptidyl-prolyl cis-trans isomerase SurA
VDASRELLRARAQEILQNRKREEETELWLRRLRDEAFVEYRIEGLGA